MHTSHEIIDRRDDNATLASVVDRGISQLDRFASEDWVDTLKLPELRLTDCSNCVLGQLYGSYGGESLRAVNINSEHCYSSSRDQAAAKYGFHMLDPLVGIPEEEQDPSGVAYCEGRYQALWRRLTAYWRTKVYARRIRQEAFYGR